MKPAGEPHGCTRCSPRGPGTLPLTLAAGLWGAGVPDASTPWHSTARWREKSHRVAGELPGNSPGGSQGSAGPRWDIRPLPQGTPPSPQLPVPRCHQPHRVRHGAEGKAGPAARGARGVTAAARGAQPHGGTHRAEGTAGSAATGQRRGPREPPAPRGRARGPAGAPQLRDGSAAEPRSCSLPPSGPVTGTRDREPPAPLSPPAPQPPAQQPGPACGPPGGGDRGAPGGTPAPPGQRGQGSPPCPERPAPATPLPAPPPLSVSLRRRAQQVGAGPGEGGGVGACMSLPAVPPAGGGSPGRPRFPPVPLSQPGRASGASGGRQEARTGRAGGGASRRFRRRGSAMAAAALRLLRPAARRAASGYGQRGCHPGAGRGRHRWGGSRGAHGVG